MSRRVTSWLTMTSFWHLWARTLTRRARHQRAINAQAFSIVLLLSPVIFPSFTIYLFPYLGHHSRFSTTPYTTHPNNIYPTDSFARDRIVNESVEFVMVGRGGFRCCWESGVVARILKKVNCKWWIYYGALLLDGSRSSILHIYSGVNTQTIEVQGLLKKATPPCTNVLGMQMRSRLHMQSSNVPKPHG